METTRRSRTPSGDIRGAILDAALILLQEQGPDSLSIRKIAATASVAPMGVYNHFTNKNGVIDALFQQGFVALGDAMSSVSEIADPREALIAAGWQYRSVALASPATYAVMFMRAVPGFVPSPDAALVAFDAFGGLIDVLGRCCAAGVINMADPTDLAMTVWAGVHGAVSLEMSDMSFCENPEEAYGRVLAMIVKGLST